MPSSPRKTVSKLKDLQAALGENQLAGSLLLTDGGKQIEAQLSSPRLDLTPFFPQEKQAETAAANAPPAAAPAKSEPPKKKFVFSETPLPLDKMKDTDAKVHLASANWCSAIGQSRTSTATCAWITERLTFDMRAAGAHEGTLQGAGTLVPAGDGTADLEMKIDISNVRASLGSEGLAPADVPPLGVAMNIKIHGSSPRQMASGANGQLLLTQGAGKTKSGFISAYGGGVVAQLAQKLNPFAKDDPFMKLDCTIARADIVNGQVTVKPVLLQTEKVTITADGTIDLHTEKLIARLQHSPAQRHRRQSGHVHQPVHPARRNIGESTDWRGCEGCGVGCAGSSYRRRDGGRRRPGRSHEGRTGSVWQDAGGSQEPNED